MANNKSNSSSMEKRFEEWPIGTEFKMLDNKKLFKKFSKEKAMDTDGNILVVNKNELVVPKHTNE